MFGTTNVKERSKFISYGTQMLKIVDMEVQKAISGTPRVVFKVEGPIIDGFTGDEGKTCQIGTIRSSYLKTPRQIDYFNEQINDMAKAFDAKDAVKSIGNTDSIEEFVDKLKEYFTDKYVWFTVSAEEYRKQDGTIGITLTLPRYKFVGKTQKDVAAFDTNLSYHYKKYVNSDIETDQKESSTGGFM